MMDYAKTASLVIKYVGGKNNIKSVTHCATRLRFQLRDNGLRNEEAISDLEGVKGVFLTQSQFQIIFGSGIVNMVCDEVQKQLGTLEEKPEEKEEGKGKKGKGKKSTKDDKETDIVEDDELLMMDEDEDDDALDIAEDDFDEEFDPVEE